MSGIDGWNHVCLFYVSRAIDFDTIMAFVWFQRYAKKRQSFWDDIIKTFKDGALLNRRPGRLVSFFRRNYRKYLQTRMEITYASFMLPELSILEQWWYFNASKEMNVYVSSYAYKSWIVQKSIFSMLIFSLWNVVLILTLFTLLLILTITIKESLKILCTSQQEHPDDIYWKYCWKGGCKCSYKLSTDSEISWISEIRK